MPLLHKRVNQGLRTSCSLESPCDLNCSDQPVHEVHELVPRQSTMRRKVTADQREVHLTGNQLKMLCRIKIVFLQIVWQTQILCYDNACTVHSPVPGVPHFECILCIEGEHIFVHIFVHIYVAETMHSVSIKQLRCPHVINMIVDCLHIM